MIKKINEYQVQIKTDQNLFSLMGKRNEHMIRSEVYETLAEEINIIRTI